MKKALALGLTLALSLSLLAGCTKPAADPAPTQTTPPAPSATTPAAYTYADTVAWDGQYDVVVIGFGGAGATAAAHAADAGAKVLLVEKAPEGHEGGNTRVCGQLFVDGNGNEQATYDYYKQLAGQHEVPDAMLKLYTKEIAHMYDKVEALFGIDQSEFVNWTGHAAIGSMSPEYPEFTGAENISLNTLHEGYSDGFLWQQFRKLVTDRADKIDVWFESPATKLVQDPQSGTVLGVTVEREGKAVNVQAINGVVLATGGFENNPEMVADYLGLTKYNPVGGLYNTGDGVTMALEVGADLWHMEAYEGIAGLAGSCIAGEPGTRARMVAGMGWGYGSCIMVAGDGSRFLREDESSRHGHVKMGDAWVNIRRPLNSFMVWDETSYATVQQGGLLAEAKVYEGDSIAALAQAIGVDAATLETTVKNFNSYAAAGYDPEQGRSAASMTALTGNKYYAVEMGANLLNTQGGPRRNENAEVLNLRGEPIPHLYSAGELGGITAFQYQGGGNIAECIVFGEIAGKNAAAPKAALPTYNVPAPVESNLTFTPGAVTDLGGETEITLGDNEYLGVSANGMGGDLKVKVTMADGKIAKVEVVEQKETEGIADPALETVPGAIVAKGSTEVDTVAGATITSKAIIEAVNDALSQVK